MPSAVLSNQYLQFNVDGESSTDVRMTASNATLTLTMGTQIVGLAAPTADDGVATKGYVDGVAEGLDIKHSCTVATTANINDFSYITSIDGITLADNDRVLVKDQTTASENGIYKFTLSSTTLTRTDDMAVGAGAAGTFTFIEEGIVNANNGFVCTSNVGSDTVQTHNLIFTQFSGAGSIIAGSGITKSSNTISITNEGVSTNKLAADAVTAEKLADNAVVTANIVDSNVTTAKIADNAVTTAKLGTIPITTLHDVLVENNSVYIGNDPSNTTSTAEKNVAVGTTALDAITEGDKNVAVGYDSLTALTTGSDNVSIGFNTLMYSNGVNNVAIGSHAMAGGSTGEAGGNVAIGKYALYAVDFDYVHGGQNGGVENVVIGSFAGSSITTGHHNICIGSGENGGLAPQPSTESGVNQIVIGHNATGQANNSVTLGNADVTAVYCAQDSGATLYAGGLNLGGNAVTATAAELNILDGVTATAAELNILDGVTATAAELNILDGVTATAAEINILDGVTATAAELNILDGVTATAAEINILDGLSSEQVLGALAVVDITTLGTSENSKVVTQSSGGVVTIGATDGNQKLNIASHDLVDGGLQLAGTLVTSSAAELNLLDGVTATTAELSILDGDTAATATTLVGADRLVVNDDGTLKQVALTDLKTYTEGALVTLSNVTTVGALNAGSITSGFGSIDVGDSTISTTGVVSGGSFGTHSDIRLKTNISEIENSIDKVKKIRGVNFKWIKDDCEDFGVIAQEVEEVAPHAVHEGSDGYKKVDYSKLTTLLIQAVKEQQTTIESQQSQIDDLKQLVNKLVNSSQ